MELWFNTRGEVLGDLSECCHSWGRHFDGNGVEFRKLEVKFSRWKREFDNWKRRILMTCRRGI